MSRGRSDLVDRLDAAGVAANERTMPVVVVGEFKRGKSTLVNALLQTAACPVDADIVTVAPTIVRYGRPPSVTVFLEPAVGESEVREEHVEIGDVAVYISESGNPDNRRHVRSVELLLPHRLLRTGLVLVDTPGVGGLDSAHGELTLGALAGAKGVLFVTDASTELTAPELQFLRRALERCQVAACVVTKIDLYPHWRRIVELDTEHLRAAGIECPVFGVSSFLRLASLEDSALLEESAFRPLVQFIGTEIGQRANAEAVQRVAAEVAFVNEQLGIGIRAEGAALASPGAAQRTVGQLNARAQHTAGVAGQAASWQQMLNDGLQDLVADIEHDLGERLRGVIRDVEKVIEDSDPKESWQDIGVWLRRQVVAAGVANHDRLLGRAQELAEDVAERFAMDTGTPLEIGSGGAGGLDELALAPAESLNAPGGRFGAMLLTTRTAMLVPTVLFGLAGGLLGAIVVAPISVALAAGIGRKMIRDERKRQVAYRRQQAKAAARRYVEEAGFVMNKETRDSLRRTGRLLRDEIGRRAATVHRSTVEALDAAKKADTLPDEVRRQRAAEVGSQTRELENLGRSTQRLLATTGAAS